MLSKNAFTAEFPDLTRIITREQIAYNLTCYKFIEKWKTLFDSKSL